MYRVYLLHKQAYNNKTTELKYDIMIERRGSMTSLDIQRFRVMPGSSISLAHRQTHFDYTFDDNISLAEAIAANKDELNQLLQKLMANDKEGFIVALQALDAAGKDEAERYLFSGLSSQGLRTTAFSKPTETDLQHDYLWKLHHAMPERGEIAVFNRSHYEEVIGARINESYLDQPLPDHAIDENIWNKRYRHINDFEHYLFDNGFYTIKIYLHISKETQKERLLQRMEDPDHLWEFSLSDLEDRALWQEHMTIFEETMQATSTDYAPWYIVPADDGDMGRYIISEILLHHIRQLNLAYPEVSQDYQCKIAEEADKLRQGMYD